MTYQNQRSLKSNRFAHPRVSTYNNFRSNVNFYTYSNATLCQIVDNTS